jgi:transposase
MRGTDDLQETLFSFTSLEGFVPADHPLRAVRVLVNEALRGLNGLFDAIYAENGRASIAPEKLMRALLLQVFYSVRSERMLMEQIRYNMLVPVVRGVAIDDAVWDHSVFSKNRDRLLEHEVVEAFFTEVMKLADEGRAAEPGALLGRWHADPGVGEPQELQAPGRRRRPEARRAGAQRADELERASAQQRHPREHDRSRRAAVPQEPQHRGRPVLSGARADGEPLGLVVSAMVTPADGLGERAAALAMLDATPGARVRTLGADKAYDTVEFVAECRRRNVRLMWRRTRAPGDAVPSTLARHASSGLRLQPGVAQADRGTLRLGQDGGADPTDRVPGHPARRSALQAHDDGLEPGPHGSNAVRGAARSSSSSFL